MMKPNKQIRLVQTGSRLTVYFRNQEAWVMDCLSEEDAQCIAATVRATYLPKEHKKNPAHDVDYCLVRHSTGFAYIWIDDSGLHNWTRLEQRKPLES